MSSRGRGRSPGRVDGGAGGVHGVRPAQRVEPGTGRGGDASPRQRERAVQPHVDLRLHPSRPQDGRRPAHVPAAPRHGVAPVRRRARADPGVGPDRRTSGGDRGGARRHARGPADNGKELHQDIAAAIGGPVFFANAYSSCQRGSGECANILLRGFFPKETDFSKVSAEALQWAEDLINDRPMKHHGWETRRRVHARALAALRAPADPLVGRPAIGLPAAASGRCPLAGPIAPRSPEADARAGAATGRRVPAAGPARRPTRAHPPVAAAPPPPLIPDRRDRSTHVPPRTSPDQKRWGTTQPWSRRGTRTGWLCFFIRSQPRLAPSCAKLMGVFDRPARF